MSFKASFLLLATSAQLSLSVEGALLAYYPFDTDFSDASGKGNDLAAGLGVPTVTTTTGEHAFGGGALDLNSTISN
ncbi:hypothetical protein N9105_06415 [Akkermansiaceae bacterium]|nr:hypothetical protein [Akkermansiaceae bacterium]